MSHVQQQQPATQSPLRPLHTPPYPDIPFPAMTPDQMIAWMEAQPPEKEGHRNPQVRHLVELNEETKANRLALCGSYILQRCPVGHEFKGRSLNCEMHTCLRCAPRMTLELYHRWQVTLSSYETDHPQAQLTYLDISQRLPRDRDLVRAFVERSKEIRGTGPLWTNLAGFVGEVAHLRVLVVTGQRPLAYWQAIWPDASVKVSVYPIYELRNIFLSRLMQVLLSASPIDRADQEVLLTRVHRFRARGIQRVRSHEETEYLSVMVGESNTDKYSFRCSRKCPHCGRYATERSQWIMVGLKKPTPDEIRWRRDT